MIILNFSVHRICLADNIIDRTPKYYLTSQSQKKSKH